MSMSLTVSGTDITNEITRNPDFLLEILVAISREYPDANALRDDLLDAGKITGEEQRGAELIAEAIKACA